MEKNGLIDRLTNKLERLLQTKYSLFGIAVISFFESALVVPIITDPFMVAYILANRSKTTLVIIVTIFSSLLGGVVAYFMGMF
ncbi:DedA family protein, partial [Candidatus Kaiserbacteria bacterium]|nr:DedA family protein [Candidatus Kaiserbacteria bacterium]